MSQTHRPVKGTRDLFGTEATGFLRIVNSASKMASSFGFQYLETPILESAAVFLRSLGDTSDIVSKEMYRFTDTGGDDLVLRPEGTAPIARAFVSLGLTHSTPLKVFYSGPMFRRERPQKGRYRQFYQFGVEVMGTDSPNADVEIIDLGLRILRELGLANKIQVRINTLGDQASRAVYRETLRSYFEARKSELSSDSVLRLEKNPLRILDSKAPEDQKPISEAPKLAQSLTEPATEFFGKVTKGLSALNIPFIIDDRLVRGLDYYNHTVFEFTTDHLGSQNAVLAGGRYDGLVEEMGGPKTPSVGWAFGIDRVHLLCEDSALKLTRVALIPASEQCYWPLYQLGREISDTELSVESTYSGALGKRLSKAAKTGADFALIMGEQEMNQGKVIAKNLKSGEQTELSSTDTSGLKAYFKK